VLSADGRWLRLKNGHAWLTKITAVGCTSSALIGAFCAVQRDSARATAAAMSLLAIAGELAAERAKERGQGVGSMQPLLLDALQLMTRDVFAERLALERARW
jgi:hydroxyethylthiazole kinase